MAQGPSRLRLEDFSDREFLALCLEGGDADGWFSAKEVVKNPLLKNLEGDTPHRHVANRCSWLWRYGILEREHLRDETGQFRYVKGDPDRPKWGQRWHLTELGEAYLSGALTKRQEGMLEKIEPERMLSMVGWFTGEIEASPDAARNLLLREWRHRTFGLKMVRLQKKGG
jgi:hypothetical protein